MPSIPGHTLKVRVAYGASEVWSIAANLACSSAIYARGDENNRDIHGTIPGYAVLNLDGRWRLARDIELFARIDNVTDRRYANFGVLGENFFPGPERTFAASRSVVEQFRGPGIPRGAWAGIRFSWP